MFKYFVIAATVTAIVTTGLFIDARSQIDAPRQEVVGPPPFIAAAGRIEGVSEEVHLRPDRAGRITGVLVTEGDWVAAGDVLLQLNDERQGHEVQLAAAKLSLAQARLQRLLNGAREQERQEAQANYRVALADLEKAEIAWTRIQQLRMDNAISQQKADDQRTLVAAMQATVDAAKARVDLLTAPPREDEIAMSQAEIAAAQAELELARVEQDRMRLLAPADGCVLAVNVRLGEIVSPENSGPTIIMADIRHFRVRAFVEELHAPRLQVGMTAKITADGIPGEVFTGHVVAISPRMGDKILSTDDPNEQFDVKTREIWIDIDGTPDLVVGLRVDVEIDIARPAPGIDAAELVGQKILR